MKILTLLISLMFLSGCSGLILRDDDNALTTTGKVTTRLVLGLATVGISEIGIDAAKQTEFITAEITNRREECKAQGMVFAHYIHPYSPVGCMTQVGWEVWVRTPSQSQVDPLAALLLMQGIQSTPRYQYQPLPAPKLGTTCFNTVAGSQIISQCY